MNREIKIISGTGHPDLAERICLKLFDHLQRKIELVPTILKQWPNGELYARVLESVRGCDVFVVQSMHCKLPYSTIEEVEFLIDCIRDSAGRITIIAPWIAYAKQDRKTTSRENGAFRVICKRLSISGTHRILLCDIHNSATSGFFDIPTDTVYIMRILIEELQNQIRELPNENHILCSPDLGSAKRIHAISQITKIRDVAIVQKIHKPDTKNKEIDLELSKILGDVTGKIVHVIDDMMQSFDTMVAALEIILKYKPKKIILYSVHPDFTNNAIKNLENCCADKIIITDTIPIKNKLPEKVTVIDPAPFLAKCIFNLHTDQSLSNLFLQY